MKRSAFAVVIAAAFVSASASAHAEPPSTTVRVDPYEDRLVTLERYAFAPNGEPAWLPVCVAPCRGRVEPYDNLRLRLDGGETKRLRVDEAGAYRATLHPVSGGQLAGGILLTVASPLILIGGFVIGIQPNHDNEELPARVCTACLAGGILLSIGALVAGVALIVDARSYVSVSKRPNAASGPTFSWRGIEFLPRAKPDVRALETGSYVLAAMDVRSLRCSSVTYREYAPSSRLAIRASRPRLPVHSTDSRHYFS